MTINRKAIKKIVQDKWTAAPREMLSDGSCNSFNDWYYLGFSTFLHCLKIYEYTVTLS